MGRVEGLGPDADAVHPARSEHPHQLGRHRLRVALHGELTGPASHRRQVVELTERSQEPFPEVHPEQAWSPAADEDGEERQAPAPGRLRAELPDQSSDELLLPVPRVDQAVEVAVVALVKAEWNV